MRELNQVGAKAVKTFRMVNAFAAGSTRPGRERDAVRGSRDPERAALGQIYGDEVYALPYEYTVE